MQVGLCLDSRHSQNKYQAYTVLYSIQNIQYMDSDWLATLLKGWKQSINGPLGRRTEVMSGLSTGVWLIREPAPSYILNTKKPV